MRRTIVLSVVFFLLTVMLCPDENSIRASEPEPFLKLALTPAGQGGAVFPTAEQLTFPAGISYVMVENGLTDSFHFLHDPAITCFRDELFTCWYNCPEGEMIDDSRIRGRRSSDFGKTWSGIETLAWDQTSEKKMYVPAQFMIAKEPGTNSGTGKDQLYSLIGIMQGGPDRIVSCGLYKYNPSDNSWKQDTIIADRFLPLGQPILLDNGNYCMPGRVSHQLGQQPKIPAVAISSGSEINKQWKVVPLANVPFVANCPETSIFVQKNEIMAIVRNEMKPFHKVFYSNDFGQTWTESRNDSFPMSSAKTYALTLSTGTRLLFYNHPDFRRNGDGSTPENISFGWGTRRTLAVAVAPKGSKTFSKLYIIQSNQNAGPTSSFYPCAVEHDKKVYIVYTTVIDNRRHCQMAIVPVESL